MSARIAASAVLLGLTAVSFAARADPIIYETFSHYPDNALISASPAGPAIGLTGDWQLDPDNFFYVNMTEADPEAGTDKAVYDMPYDDNGARTAQRLASPLHELFGADGDVFYASFRIQPARADGYMLFTLTLEQLAQGGQPDISFGMKDGSFVVGNGGVNVDVYGGVPEVAEMQVVLRVEYGEGAAGPDEFEVVTLWVDPVDETSTPVIDQAEIDFLNRGGGRITGVAIRGDQMDGQPAFFDDLMVGYEFIDVIEAPPPDALTNHVGLNGLFYDPDNPGHGFNFVVHSFGLAVYYYGHTANGERLWLVSGNYEGDLEYDEPIPLDLFEVTDGVFGAPQLPVTSWGTMTLEMTDCDTGHASLDGLDGTLEIDLVRLSALPGIGCR